MMSHMCERMIRHASAGVSRGADTAAVPPPDPTDGTLTVPAPGIANWVEGLLKRVVDVWGSVVMRILLRLRGGSSSCSGHLWVPPTRVVRRLLTVMRST